MFTEIFPGELCLETYPWNNTWTIFQSEDGFLLYSDGWNGRQKNAYELRHKGQITYNIKKGRSKENSFGSPSNLRKIIRKSSGGSLIRNVRVGLTAWKYMWRAEYLNGDWIVHKMMYSFPIALGMKCKMHWSDINYMKRIKCVVCRDYVKSG